jgi:hypothetical protein
MLVDENSFSSRRPTAAARLEGWQRPPKLLFSAPLAAELESNQTLPTASTSFLLVRRDEKGTPSPPLDLRPTRLVFRKSSS